MDESISCPHCHQTARQLKVGRNPSGSRRYLCVSCGRKYTPAPKHHGYDEELRRQAVRLYLDGMNLRRIGRTLGVVHQTVANWIAAEAAMLPKEPPLPERSRPHAGAPEEPLAAVEFDERHTFEGEKKSASTC